MPWKKGTTLRNPGSGKKHSHVRGEKTRTKASDWVKGGGGVGTFSRPLFGGNEIRCLVRNRGVLSKIGSVGVRQQFPRDLENGSLLLGANQITI